MVGSRRVGAWMSVCLALYLIADQPLPVVRSEVLDVAPIRKPRWRRPAVAGEYVYRFGPPGCACSFLRDGHNHVIDALRRQQMEAATQYLHDVCMTSPVTVLAAWMGDEHKEPIADVGTPGSFSSIDFDRAWERPIRVRLAAGHT